jgi:nitrogen regulatory protein P-II 1
LIGMAEARLYKVEVILREEKVEALVEELGRRGYSSMTVTEVRGRGRQGGWQEQFRGRTYVIPFLPKIKVELVVEESDLEPVTAAIAEVARTGEIGDGKIFVYPIANAIRIRTGEKGAAAL